MRYNITMSKKKTILDELSTGLGGILLVIVLFGGYTIFSMFTSGVTEQKIKNIYSLLPVFAFVLFAFLVSLVVRDSRNRKLVIAKAASEKSKHIAERSRKYRQFYNLPEDTQLYHYDDIFSDYPMESTSHEKSIAKKLIASESFSSNCIFLDSYFRAKNGKTIQIDIIAVGRRGIFVIESKDYSGWIFGNGGQTYWTQTIYRNKSRFYNPIKQNASHINALKDIVGSNAKFHSLIVFGDSATIKDVSYIPKDTYVLSSHRLYEVLGDIGTQTEAIYSAEEVIKLCRKIHKSRIIPDEKLRSSHVEEIKDQTGENRLYS